MKMIIYIGFYKLNKYQYKINKYNKWSQKFIFI